MRKFSELVHAMSPESQQRVADRVESALNGIVKTCTKCNGGRIIFREHTQSTETVVSCPKCGGTGHEPEQGTYYVIWFNRRSSTLELHAAHCRHELFSNPVQYENIGAESGDPQEGMRLLHRQHTKIPVSIEDCLR